jgi:hypothetical protein
VKKRPILILVLILTLILSGGMYAYAFNTATATIGITEPTGDIGTVTTNATQPNWSQITSVQQRTQTLRPDTAGSQTGLSQVPATGNQWDKVDEVTVDSDTTYVYSSASNYQEDLYNIATPNNFGQIIYVKVYLVVRATVAPTRTTAYVHIVTGGNQFNSPELTVTTGYDTYSYQWNQNPNTGQAWSWSDIDALQIGAGLRRPAVGSETRLTQVYAEVVSHGIAQQDNVPTGGLFKITTPNDFTVDLTVRVYLVNTGNLVKAFQYLNMEVYLAGSEESGKNPNYRLLTLTNGATSFNLPGPAPGEHILSLVGGSYGLVSSDTSEWSPGWTIIPQLYCEVAQR